MKLFLDPQGKIWHSLPMQGKEKWIGFGGQGGEYHEEGRQTNCRTRGRNHEKVTASSFDSTLRCYRNWETNLRHFRTVRFKKKLFIYF